MNKAASIWCQIPHDLKFELQAALIKSQWTKIGKKSSQCYLYAFETFLILAKTENQPKAFLQLDFDTKFEILRAPVKKLSEDDERLGDIESIQLSREGNNKKFTLTSSVEQIVKWRSFLSERINQMEFHSMFRVFKKIGKGNFASVYYAERIEDGLEVAVKAFSKAVAYGEENGKEAIVNEITLMRKLNHPNIMKLYEVYETSNSLYMCLELLEGGSLYDMMKNKSILSGKQVQQIIYGILSGLRHMHQKDIMHRDLKLENLVFRKTGALDTIMIADFGLATHVHEKVYLYCRCGTPGYVAPEVINIKDMSQTYSSVCDIYSAGLVFHLLLTGKAVFSGRSYNTVVRLNREAKIDFKSKVFDIVPQSALNLLKLMLEKDPKQRITAEDCLEHEFFAGFHSKDAEFDYVEEIEDEIGLDARMNKINEEASKFDMLRINQLQNSPIQSPQLNATKNMKGTLDTDSENFMHMRSPVITGRQHSVENSPTTADRVDSPMRIQPSKFKNAQNPMKSSLSPKNSARISNAENALYKYALRKNTNQQHQQQQQQQQTQPSQFKSVHKNLSQNI